MRQIILVGGGGHCKSVIEAAESAGYTIKGILDLPQFMGNKVLDYAVIGSDEEIPLYVNECDFVVTLGYIKNPLLRDKLHERIEGGRWKSSNYCRINGTCLKVCYIGCRHRCIAWCYGQCWSCHWQGVYHQYLS